LTVYSFYYVISFTLFEAPEDYWYNQFLPSITLKKAVYFCNLSLLETDNTFITSPQEAGDCTHY